VMFFRPKEAPKKMLLDKGFLAVGFFTAATLIFQMLAIQLTLVAYVISIKRTSALMVVVFGAIFFREKGLKHRLAGVLLMLAGVVLITIL